jgi:drug/metabolite transporter (DMT)-like permease
MTERLSGRALGLLAMTVAVVSFSTSSSLIKWSDSTGSVIAFWRMIGAVIGWWTVVTIARVRSNRPVPTASTWKLAFAPGIAFGANIALFFTAITKTSIAHAEFITALNPLVLLPAGAFFFGERPNWNALRWGAISIIGVTLVLFFGPEQGASSVSGDLLMIGVISFWTTYLLTSKRARAAGVGTLDFMACMMPIGVLTAGPIAAIIAGTDIIGLSARGWIVVAVLTLLTGMLSHGCIVFAQQHIPVATIGIMQTAQPALAVFFAFVLLGEEVRVPQVLGMGLVITGLALFTLASTRSAALSTPATPVEAI